MPLSALLRRPAFTLSILLALAGIAALPAAAQAPAPAPAPAPTKTSPEAIDAWGNTVDVAQKIHEQLGISVTAKMGSQDWVPVAMRMLELHGEILPRLYYSAGLDIECGKRYRQEHPKSTREQYQDFGATAVGQAWTKTCVAQLLADPQADPKLADGMIASIEVGFMLPNLLQAMQQRRKQLGQENTKPELTPEMEEKVPGMTKEAFAMSNCLIRKALEQVSLSQVVTDPSQLQPPIVAAVKAGLCNFPTPPPVSQ